MDGAANWEDFLTLGWLNTLDMNYDPEEICLPGIFLEFLKSWRVFPLTSILHGVRWKMVAAEENLQLLLERKVTESA